VAAGEHAVDALALVLVDIAARIEPDGVQKIQAFMTRNPEGFDSLEQVADAIASYQPHRERPANLQGLAKNVRLGADGRYRWHWDPRLLQGHRDLALRQARMEARQGGRGVPASRGSTDRPKASTPSAPGTDRPAECDGPERRAVRHLNLVVTCRLRRHYLCQVESQRGWSAVPLPAPRRAAPVESVVNLQNPVDGGPTSDTSPKSLRRPSAG